ncbi:tetratricopeptide repeat-containing sensor histidine kinase [Olleya sp. HaHaR_3_96]|uniref:tetratricopeptide repeat-containing sensor histidine kinase n=1 Tax=Olleya sp. HaHaR_3_96 TaxID=2745560 RepID=UPI001C5004EC|nr:tetratricopeptide repeat-containing sensor histidine kinase [Olleya sp. HaHaR_3_96]QXP60298.1 two-component sensor histidine kinase [Olleya sp. HaHaR_3_96]
MIGLLWTSLCFGQTLDSIYHYRSLAENDNFTISEQISFAKSAVRLSLESNRDTTILNSKKRLSYLYLLDKNYESLKVINYENLTLARKLKDTTSIANADYILGYYYEVNQKSDSAYSYYYNAVKLYDKLNDHKNQAAVLVNMANIQEAERDYIGAQNNVIRAISLFDKLPKDDYNLDTLWSLYNTLGIISGELQQYDNSIDYHNKALKNNSGIKDVNVNFFNQIYSKINIASTYRKKKDYNNAIEKYNNILQDNRLRNKDPSSYAYVINDLAYSMFLRGKDSNIKIEKLYRQAFNLSDSIFDKNIKKSVSLNLSDYFKSTNQLDSAAYYSSMAYNSGKDLKDYKTILKALYQKSKIEKGESSKEYLFEYIKLNDSLLLAERSVRNKFMKIDFETAEIKEENQEMSRQRLWLIIISMGLLGVLFFLYVIKTQREKNKELLFERQQQKTNEEIYNLMLSQQDKIDEARSLEKNRISKDIHDGILGKLFGVRLSLDGLNLSTTIEATQKRSVYITELKNIEEEIRKVSHELNSDFIGKSGYLDIVKTLVDSQMTAYDVSYKFDIQEGINWDALDNKIKIHVYRILQETMQNTYKHAKATVVDISFHLNDNNNLILSVSDNGEGFDLQKAKKGIGLKNIDSRMQEINGKLIIDSIISKGTKITISVPILEN